MNKPGTDLSGYYILLLEQFQTQSLKGFGCDDLMPGVCAGGAVIAYLRENQKGAVDHINRVEPLTISL